MLWNVLNCTCMEVGGLSRTQCWRCLRFILVQSPSSEQQQTISFSFDDIWTCLSQTKARDKLLWIWIKCHSYHLLESLAFYVIWCCFLKSNFERDIYNLNILYCNIQNLVHLYLRVLLLPYSISAFERSDTFVVLCLSNDDIVDSNHTRGKAKIRRLSEGQVYRSLFKT
jgi:hypothetical protein